MLVHNSSIPRNSQTEELLAKILNKVEESDMMLQEMRSEFLSLTDIVTFHSSSIRLLEEQMIQLASLLYSNPTEELMGYMNDDAMNTTKYQLW